MRLPSIATAYLYLKSLISKGSISIGARSRISILAVVSFRKGEVRLGERTRIHRGAIVDAQKGRIIFGRNVSMNPYSIVYGAGGVTIGDNVRIAAHAVIVSFDHNFNDLTRSITSQGTTNKPIEIGNDVWIGSGAKVLGGAKIAEGCIIGAGAVLKGATEPYGIYVGNPARLIKRRGGPEA